MAEWDLNRALGILKRAAGKCAANTQLEDVKASVQLAQKRIDQAVYGGRILQGESRVFNKLTEASNGLGAVGEGLENVQDICIDITAMSKIHDAVLVLMDDNVIYNDPQAAADSFDLLFQGIGRLCRFLPPPAKAWGSFFEEFNLFGNVQKNIYKPYFSRLNDARDGTGQYSSR